jgi:hypothetical protein
LWSHILQFLSPSSSPIFNTFMDSLENPLILL